jgi:hypothetical protein
MLMALNLKKFSEISAAMSLKKHFLTSIVLSIFFLSCEENNINALESELPEKTTAGLNTFGCLVDNEKWIPDVDRNLNPTADSTLLYMDKKTGLVYVEAINVYKDKNLVFTTERVSFSVKGINKPGIYSLSGSIHRANSNKFYISKPSNSSTPIELLGGGCYYRRGSIFKLSGNTLRILFTGDEDKKETNLNIVISRIDFDNFVFSGTFEFSPTAFYTSIAIDKMKITKGRFDLKGEPFPNSFFNY